MLTVEGIGFSVVRLVAEVATTMRLRAAEKGISLAVQFDGPIPEQVRTDPLRVRQILMNLVGNAVKFTHRGRVEIVVKCDNPNAPDPRLRIEVRDTGIGIRPEHLGRLFHPFAQADGSTTREYGGSGLGLVISQRLAKALGGEISVQSEFGSGSTFTVTLATGDLHGVPMLHDAHEAAITTQAGGPGPHGAHPTLTGRILVADDGADNRRLISTILTRHGASVELVNDGRHAVDAALAAAAAGRAFDLIVLDMQMPVLDGYGAAASLRSKGIRTPIVALTAHAMADDRQKCLGAGCDDYAAKPIDRDALVRLCADGWPGDRPRSRPSWRDDVSRVSPVHSPSTPALPPTPLRLSPWSSVAQACAVSPNMFNVLALSATLMISTAPHMPDSPGPAPPDALPRATRSEVYSTRGMAATSHPLATQIALDVLKAGGSAVDAAIAANAALGLMEPTGCGIGGDLFAIVWDPATRKLHGYNGSGRAPAKLTIEVVTSRGLTEIPRSGPLPVTVPGCVDGWFALHARFGKRPMRDNLAPAIAYAREGFPISPVIAQGWSANVRAFALMPNFKEQFTFDGRAPRAGEIWTNPHLAATLQRIADSGRDAFYKGLVPQTVEKFIAEQGGVLSAADFAAHQGEWTDPVSANYRGFDVWELPQRQGIAALADPQDPRGARSQVHGLRQRGSRPRIHRGQETRLRGPRASTPIRRSTPPSRDSSAPSTRPSDERSSTCPPRPRPSSPERSPPAPTPST